MREPRLTWESVDVAPAAPEPRRADRARWLGFLAGGLAATVLGLLHLPPLWQVEATSELSAFAVLVIVAVPLAMRVRTAESRNRRWTVSVRRAQEAERVRVVRDLHDGAQQRLVHAVIALKLAQRSLNGAGDTNALMAEALTHAEQAIRELRDLAHGVVPQAVTHGGLRAGVESLASRVPLPVAVKVRVGRLPLAVEASAYFVIAEALTNIVKHSGATAAEVRATVARGGLRVEVRDDGVGGARLDGGPGLRGLRDRVESLGGRLHVESAPRHGTRIVARVPLPAPGGDCDLP